MSVCLFFDKTEFYLSVFSFLMSTFNFSNSSLADKCLTKMAMTDSTKFNTSFRSYSIGILPRNFDLKTFLYTA